MIDHSFYQAISNNNSIYTIALERSGFPAPDQAKEAVEGDIRNIIVGNIAGLWLTLALLPPFYVLLAELVYEKETKLREAMKVSHHLLIFYFYINFVFFLYCYTFFFSFFSVSLCFILMIFIIFIIFLIIS